MNQSGIVQGTQPSFDQSIYLLAYRLGEQGIHESFKNVSLEQTSRDDFRVGIQDGTTAARMRRQAARARLSTGGQASLAVMVQPLTIEQSVALRAHVARLKDGLNLDVVLPCPVCGGPRAEVPNYGDKVPTHVGFVCADMLNADLGCCDGSPTSRVLLSHMDASWVRLPYREAAILSLCAFVENILTLAESRLRLRGGYATPANFGPARPSGRTSG